MPTTALLAGYRVLDLSQYIPGPFAARSLADLGAEVIKVEPPHGDPMRSFMFEASSERPSPVYRHLNRGKTVCRLDLKSERDRETLTHLLRDADVLIESYRPGVLARLGFGRDRIEALNPRLVHCALSGYGQSGPFRDRAGHDLTYCAVAGALSATGTAERPLMAFPPIADHAGAMQAVNAILAALLRRERSDGGAFLDISLTESILGWQYLGLITDTEQSHPQREAALLNGGAACYNIYRTADERFVVLAALEEKFWRAFCERVEQPQWIERQHEALPQRPLIAELRQLFRQRTQDEWSALLQPSDCCFEPVPAAEGVTTHPQFLARQALSGNAPAFPGWIDGEPVATCDSLTELADDRRPVWRETRKEDQ
jgi:crotonobetainyl-CoA:carnitine CoA-transferase CaiB-like acyl-CoA transferase